MDVARRAIREATKAINERLEYELRGAWRAGYDYLHIYDDPTPQGPTESFSVGMYALPGYKGGPRPDPPQLVYRTSYDLTSVPDEVLREFIRRTRS